MRAVGVVLALIGGFGLVVTMGAFVLSSICWEYCEDEPTVGDALQFALPFGLVTLAFLTAAAHLLTPGRGSWPRAVVVALGSAVLGGLLTWAAVAFWEAVDGGVLAWIGGVALAGAWLYSTAFAAGLAASSE
jgi:hypothetical protein